MHFYCKLHKSKGLFLLSFLILIFCFLFLIPLTPNSDVSFRKMTDRIFLEDITTDTLSLHYTLAYPDRYSLNSYPITLPEFNKKLLAQSYSKIENNLATLTKIDKTSFNNEEAYCYDLLMDYFSMSQRGFPYTYLEECFTPSSGIVSNYPVLMAEYTFRTKKDVTDYLTLLADTPHYFSSYFEFQKERAKKGYRLASASLEETMEQCDTIITKEALENNSHFLQISFHKRLSSLMEQNIITKEEAFEYIEKNNALLKNILLPTYQKLKNALFSLQTTSVPLQGLYQKKAGKEYYEWLVQKQVGTSLSIKKMLDKLETDFEKNLLEFQLLQKKLTSFENYESLLITPFPLTDKYEILKILQRFSGKDFPGLSKITDKPINTTIKSVSKCMEDYTSPAFYMVPPIDDIGQNTIYINNSSTPAGLELFTTLAHEGYPGHLYQTVYYQLYADKNDTPEIRHIMNYSGYVEGWAIYCEFASYEYAAMLYPKDLQDFFSLWHKLLACEKKLQLGILSILDINLHYYDDSMETAKRILEQYGITDSQTIQDVRRYVLEEPGNYLKYYMGYLLLKDIKEKAESMMNSAFSEMKFHEFILNAGPSDFDNLERKLFQTFS